MNLAAYLKELGDNVELLEMEHDFYQETYEKMLIIKAEKEKIESDRKLLKQEYGKEKNRYISEYLQNIDISMRISLDFSRHDRGLPK